MVRYESMQDKHKFSEAEFADYVWKQKEEFAIYWNEKYKEKILTDVELCLALIDCVSNFIFIDVDEIDLELDHVYKRFISSSLSQMQIFFEKLNFFICDEYMEKFIRIKNYVAEFLKEIIDVIDKNHSSFSCVGLMVQIYKKSSEIKDKGLIDDLISSQDKFLENHLCDICFILFLASIKNYDELFDVYTNLLESHKFDLYEIDSDILPDNVKKNIYDEINRVNNQKIANKRWSDANKQRPMLKERYLKTMRDKKLHTITQATEYIFQYENPENKTYRWIYEQLSKAIKGDFT